MRQITKHLPHYISLIGIFGFALWGFFSFSYDKVFQSAIVVAFGASFVVWGIVHHHIHDDLHHKIILEYAASGLMGVVILLALIWTA